MKFKHLRCAILTDVWFRVVRIITPAISPFTLSHANETEIRAGTCELRFIIICMAPSTSTQIFRLNLEGHSAALTGEPHFCRFMSPSPRRRGLRCRACSGPEALCQYLLSPTSEIHERLRAGLARASSSPSASSGLLQQTPEDQQLQTRSGHKIETYIGLSCAEEFQRHLILTAGRRSWSGEFAGPCAGARWTARARGGDGQHRQSAGVRVDDDTPFVVERSPSWRRHDSECNLSRPVVKI